MTRIGFQLACEEHPPDVLIATAAGAERAGFIGISDHFHPWTREQGQSAFVWGVLGGIAPEHYEQATERVREEDVAEGICALEIRTATSRRCASTPRPATTTCSSGRSGPTRTGRWPSTRTRCCRGSGPRR